MMITKTFQNQRKDKKIIYLDNKYKLMFSLGILNVKYIFCSLNYLKLLNLKS